jgi:hypothetical protein
MQLYFSPQFVKTLGHLCKKKHNNNLESKHSEVSAKLSFAPHKEKYSL